MSERRPAEVFHPGEFIQEEIKERGWSVQDLVARMAPCYGSRLKTVTVAEMEAILAQKAPVTQRIAFKLSKALGTSFEVWINCQASYDSWHAWKDGKGVG